MYLNQYLVLLGFLGTTNCARILGIVPLPSYSHQVVFRPIWRELSLRGHDVTVLTTDPMNDSTLTNLKEIDLHGAYNFWNIAKLSETNSLNILKQTQIFMESITNVIDFELKHPEVQKIITNKTEHFDLIMIEYYIPTMFAFSERFNCPFIGITSMDAPNFGHHALGNPTNPIMYPNLQLPYLPPLKFFERLASFFFYLFEKVIGTLAFFTSMENTVKKHFPGVKHSLTEISKNVSMVFINTNPIYHNIRPLGPTTIQFGGGGFHINPAKKLPDDIQLYLDSAKEGAIYFSLGTNAKSNSVNKALRQVFMDALKNLPYKVLWKFDIDLPNLPSNIKIIKWGPQQDILRHPNIKLFVSQAGLQSTDEAIHMKIPMVLIPFFGDQDGNAKRIELKGFGKTLDKNTLDVNTLTKTINEVMTNPKYKQSVTKLAELSLDQPMTGIDKVVWWTEYVLRHKGASHFKSVQVPMYQYLFLDVIAFIVSILSIFGFVSYIVLRYLIKKCVRTHTKKVKVQ